MAVAGALHSSTSESVCAGTVPMPILIPAMRPGETHALHLGPCECNPARSIVNEVMEIVKRWAPLTRHFPAVEQPSTTE